MPFELLPFRPQLQLAPPIEQANQLRLQLATWRANATVRIRNEAGRFKVGWVQAVVRNDITAIYDNNDRGPDSHRCECRINLNPLPILDSGAGEQPWYFNTPACAPEVVATNPAVVQAAPRMGDRPSHSFVWACGHAQHAPLIEVTYEVTFRTWLAVQDITVQPAQSRFVAVLYNFMYTIHSRLVVDTTRAVGSRATRP